MTAISVCTQPGDLTISTEWLHNKNILNTVSKRLLIANKDTGVIISVDKLREKLVNFYVLSKCRRQGNKCDVAVCTYLIFVHRHDNGLRLAIHDIIESLYVLHRATWLHLIAQIQVHICSAINLWLFMNESNYHTKSCLAQPLTGSQVPPITTQPLPLSIYPSRSPQSTSIPQSNNYHHYILYLYIWCIAIFISFLLVENDKIT